MRKIYYILFLSVIIFCVFVNVENVFAYSDYEENGINLDELDDVVKEKTDDAYSFTDIIDQIINGDNGIIGNIINVIKTSVANEISYHKNTVIRIVSIAIFLALLTNIMVAFGNTEFSETGFLIVYLILIELLIVSFVNIVDEAVELIDAIMQFMECLVPAFFLSVGLSSGITTSTGMCALTLTVMTVLEFIICKILFPAISIYVILSLVSIVSKENKMTKASDGILSLINWSIKTIFGVALGLNIIKCMVLPSADTVGKNSIIGVASMFPIIGNTINGASKLLVSSGNVIKNSIGGAGVVALVIIALIPIIKLLVNMGLYKAMTIIVEPISDKRVVEAIEVLFKACCMIYKICITAIIIFAASIAVVCAMT